MTVESLLRVFRAQWYLLVVGVLLTAGAAVLAMRPTPLYWAQADVLVVAPGQTAQDVPIEIYREGMISFAALLEDALNDGPVLRLNQAPLYGVGVKDGYSVQVPGSGNQWAGAFSRPALSVEVVAREPDRVREQFRQVVDTVVSAGTAFQAAQGVQPSARMTLVPVTENPTVLYVGSTSGQKFRSVAAIGVIGAVGTSWVAVVVDRRWGTAAYAYTPARHHRRRGMRASQPRKS